MKKILLVLIMLVAFPVEAKEINHFTTKVDTEVTLEDTYNSSVAVAGDNITFDGTFKGISIGAGNKVIHSGNSDYAMLAGNSIDLEGIINNDAIIAGNIVTTKEDLNVKRDAIIAASDVELNGEFNRNLSVYSSMVTFKNAHIKGNVKLYTSQVKIEKGTVIEGTLSYPEDSTYKADKGATIGKVIKTKAIQTEDDENFFATVSAKLWSFLCLTVVFAVISLLFPKALQKIDKQFEKDDFGSYVEVFTKGLITLILAPVVAVLLFCTLIGVPLGILTIVAYAVSLYLTTIFTAYLIGYKIWQKVFKKDTHVLLIGILGLFILFVLSIIPGIRTLASILTTVIGLGLIIDVVKPTKAK